MRVIYTAFVGLVFALSGSAAYADNSYVTTGKLVEIQPIHTQVQSQTPYEECKIVDVPVYGNAGGGASGGDVLTGMIIGGLLGKGATGKDNGAAAGAVIGGIIAADKGNNRQVITGYTRQRQCVTKYQTGQSTIVNQYNLVYRVDGTNISVTVNRAQGERARIGERKRFRVRYHILN
jgi:uncharacterized protein YcfJ